VADEAAQGVGDDDARVGTEAPGALDAVLAGGRASELAAQRGEADAADAQGGGEVGEGLGLAEADVGAKTQDSGDGLQLTHGGISPTV
jgi:hypothetical protein